MRRIPRGRDVDRGLKAAARGIKLALKELNQQAARLISRGDYSAAEELVASARAVTAFQNDVDAIKKLWREVQRGSRPASDDAPTPVWKYYVPTLRVLMSLGGSATRRDIENAFASTSDRPFPETDLKTHRGRPFWKIMLQRSLPAMAKEGFVQRDKKHWRITPAGRTASEVKTPDETTP